MLSNGMTLLLNSYSNLTTLSSAMYSSDFELLGKTMGEITFTALGNDKLKEKLEREEQDEKDAFQAMNQRALDSW
jgi:hypothetical protein